MYMKKKNRFGDKHFKHKCYVTPFTFEVGHNIPESKGGDSYTIDEFSQRTSECFRFNLDRE